jgi:hypothetical protein
MFGFLPSEVSPDAKISVVDFPCKPLRPSHLKYCMEKQGEEETVCGYEGIGMNCAPAWKWVLYRQNGESWLRTYFWGRVIAQGPCEILTEEQYKIQYAVATQATYDLYVKCRGSAPWPYP